MSFDLATVAKAMLEHRVLRVKFETGAEVELHPSAFDRVAQGESLTIEQAAEAEADTMCKCGHDLVTMHNEAGCLGGCPHLDCVPEETPEAEP